MTNRPFWFRNTALPKFSRFTQSDTADVVVIGGGVTGLTAAYLLAEEGRKVILLERDRCGHGDTGHTTAHITAVTDLRLYQLVKRFSRDHARAVWEAGEAALNQIEQVVKAENIACGFRRVPAFLTGRLERRQPKDIRDLQRELKTALELGLDAHFVDRLCGVDRPAVVFPNQALFHPMQYLAGLARALVQRGGRIFERSEVNSVEGDPPVVHANGKRIKCGAVFIATHVPIIGKTNLLKATLFQTKIYPYSSYVVGARVSRGALPHASLFDISEPYYFLRVDPRPRFHYAIFGGQDHKTGQAADTERRFAKLERLLRKLAPSARVDAKWSGQVIETSDGLPYIGEIVPHQLVATGFAGNGITFGTLAGMMTTDAIMRRANPWERLFAPNRKVLRGGTWDYVKENLDYPYYMVKDRLARSEGSSTRNVRHGQGRILRLKGTRTAVYRAQDGTTTRLSPVCTHMGCIVAWNASEATWDCPCHGSRFHPTGEVLAGPAEEPLKGLSEE